MLDEPNWTIGPFAGWIAATEPNATIAPGTMAVDTDNGRVVSLVAAYGEYFVIIDQTGSYGFLEKESLMVPPATGAATGGAQ